MVQRQRLIRGGSPGRRGFRGRRTISTRRRRRTISTGQFLTQFELPSREAFRSQQGFIGRFVRSQKALAGAQIAQQPFMLGRIPGVGAVRTGIRTGLKLKDIAVSGLLGQAAILSTAGLLGAGINPFNPFQLPANIRRAFRGGERIQEVVEAGPPVPPPAPVPPTAPEPFPPQEIPPSGDVTVILPPPAPVPAPVQTGGIGLPSIIGAPSGGGGLAGLLFLLAATGGLGFLAGRRKKKKKKKKKKLKKRRSSRKR